MTLDPRARRFLDVLNAAARYRSGPIQASDLRSASKALAAFAAPAPAVERRADALSPEVALRVYSPQGRADEELPGLVYFHGGGWVSGDLDTHDALCATLAGEAECRVVAVDYRLAPESRYPAAQDDAASAVLAVAADPSRWAIDPGRLGVAGDSAGGHLAAVAVQRVRDAGVPLALQLLICPVMDALARTASRHELSSGYLLEETTMERHWEFYRVEGLDPDDPVVAPLRAASFAGLPRALIHTAQYDPMRDEGALYAEALEGAGVPVSYTMHAGLIHNFQGLGAVIPAGQAALLAICAELKEAFALPFP